MLMQKPSRSRPRARSTGSYACPPKNAQVTGSEPDMAGGSAAGGRPSRRRPNASSTINSMYGTRSGMPCRRAVRTRSREVSAAIIHLPSAVGRHGTGQRAPARRRLRRLPSAPAERPRRAGLARAGDHARWIPDPVEAQGQGTFGAAGPGESQAVFIAVTRKIGDTFIFDQAIGRCTVRVYVHDERIDQPLRDLRQRLAPSPAPSRRRARKPARCPAARGWPEWIGPSNVWPVQKSVHLPAGR